MDKTSWTDSMFWTLHLMKRLQSASILRAVACISDATVARGDGINGFNSDIHAVKDVKSWLIQWRIHYTARPTKNRMFEKNQVLELYWGIQK